MTLIVYARKGETAVMLTDRESTTTAEPTPADAGIPHLCCNGMAAIVGGVDRVNLLAKDVAWDVAEIARVSLLPHRSIERVVRHFSQILTGMTFDPEATASRRVTLTIMGYDPARQPTLETHTFELGNNGRFKNAGREGGPDKRLIVTGGSPAIERAAEISYRQADTIEAFVALLTTPDIDRLIAEGNEPAQRVGPLLDWTILSGGAATLHHRAGHAPRRRKRRNT